MITRHSLLKKRGFTLLEILLVIAAIGILAAIVIVAINPQRQLEQVRQAERSSNINTVQKALTQYLIDQGEYPVSPIPGNYTEICATGTLSPEDDFTPNNCLDLRDLVPTYIAAVPEDGTSVNETGYFVKRDILTQEITVLFEEDLEQPIVSGGLVFHVDAGNADSYPGTGNTWFDLTSNQIEAVFHSDTVPFDGLGMVFDGVSDRFDIVNNAGYKVSYPFTITSWIKKNSNKVQWVFASDQYNCTNWSSPPSGPDRYYGYHLRFSSNGSLGFSIGNGGVCGPNSRRDLSTQTILDNDTWYQITLVINGSTDAQYYLNGVQQSEPSYSGNGGGLSYSSNDARIGASSYLPTERHFDGSIGNIAVYNRVLTPEEVEFNFEATRSRFGL